MNRLRNKGKKESCTQQKAKNLGESSDLFPVFKLKIID
jgi:hypothetical protein